MAHRASSETWGDFSGARLCELVVRSNTGGAHAVADGRTDMLDLMSFEELNEADDIGIKLNYLAVYYDQPDIIIYLANRGVNMTTWCDPMNWGSPLYYAVTLQRHRILEALDQIGVNFNEPCDNLGQTAMLHAKRIRDTYGQKLIKHLMERTQKAGILVLKNLRKMVQQNKYQRILNAANIINRVLRGRRGRLHWVEVHDNPTEYWEKLELLEEEKEREEANSADALINNASPW